MLERPGAPDIDVTTLQSGARVDRWRKGRRYKCIVVEEGVVLPEYLVQDLEDMYKKRPADASDEAANREWEAARDALLVECDKLNFKK